MTQCQINLLLSRLAQDDFRRDVTAERNALLSRHCSFRIGGEADFLLTPRSEQALLTLIRFLQENGIRFQVLGKGSNLLFEDGGYRGVVVQTAGLCTVAVEGNRIIAECGAPLGAAASAALSAGLTGMEFLAGIPGTVGGAVYMNAGAYDGEVSGILTRVRCASLIDGSVYEKTPEQCELSYRHSVFMQKKELVLRAEFTLKQGSKETIRERMEELMRLRTEKQPLQYPSAGSTFKRYPGRFTAKMIDEAGMRGYAIGGAQVSEKHAGFLINRGGATCADMKALIDAVRDRVEQVHGIRIEREVEYIPETEEEKPWS